MLSIQGYVIKLSSIRAELNLVLSPGKIVAEELAQRDTLMVCALVDLGYELSSACDQLLSSASIPTLDDVLSRLLRVFSVTPTIE